ncbi:MAG: hypothetical protein CO187_03095 [Zetaproteobacteria bacterium CG_4_9_14_3_um_filter_53_7]|nr:MAG: hypothetical protein CO187_03095 [Zetaproteobacteria bacterium CG_4_9_14_3_um_filter_53_7]
MQGVITTKSILQNPLVIIEGFGLRVFINALFADKDATFLDIISQCHELDAHKDMARMNLSEIVNQFIGYELKAQELYTILSKNFSDLSDVSAFFKHIASHEEGHAIVLARVRREIERGHYWKESKQIHISEIERFDRFMKEAEAAVLSGVSLAEALALVDQLEGSEINIVFENLNKSVDMKSRKRFEKFFVMTTEHVGYCEKQTTAFRKKYAALVNP